MVNGSASLTPTERVMPSRTSSLSAQTRSLSSRLNSSRTHPRIRNSISSTARLYSTCGHIAEYVCSKSLNIRDLKSMTAGSPNSRISSTNLQNAFTNSIGSVKSPGAEESRRAGLLHTTPVPNVSWRSQKKDQRSLIYLAPVVVACRRLVPLRFGVQPKQQGRETVPP